MLFDGVEGDYMPVASQLGILLALSLRDDEGHHTTGSASMIGPGIAICAAHVLGDSNHFAKFQRGDVSLVAQALTPDGLLLWTVLRASRVPDSDLFVLSMALSSAVPPHRRFNHASITTRMPALGDEIVVTGFTAVSRTQPKSKSLNIDVRPGCYRGRVIDVFPEGRDRVMMLGPCFAADCNALGGMSGGSVFDSRGFLVGIVSTSCEGFETTFVSHIWPALVRGQACPVWPTGIGRPPAATPLQLGLKFGIHIDRPGAFQLCVHNGEISLRYVAWN